MWVVPYVLAIVAVNKLYMYLPLLQTPLGEVSAANLIVGSVFVLRDYAQRAIGHWVLLATFTAGVITWFMVDEALAVASLTAFTISEMTDWAVYTFTKMPLQRRILYSSMISVPVDSLAFLYLFNMLNPASFTVEVFSKIVGVAAVWVMLRQSTRRNPIYA